MPATSVSEIITKVNRAALIVLAVALALFVLLSLQWRFQHDTALLFYISFLFEHFGYFPYRDVFDVNLPLTYLTYAMIGRFTGYSDLGVRFADLTMLGGLMLMTWQWMKIFGRHVAWAGAIVFGLVYLRLGPAVSLQREFLILLPVLGGILAFTQLRRFKPEVRAALSGFLFGIACLIKPHAVLAFPILVMFEIAEQRTNIRSVLVQTVLPAIGGFLVPILVFLIYLTRFEALQPFLSVIRQYYPLYAQLNGEQSTLAEGERLGYLLHGYFQFGGFGWWWIPALWGLYAFLRTQPNKNQRRQAILLLTLMIGYSLYPVFSGKFWHYHWLLFAYFSVQAGALSLDQADATPVVRRMGPIAMFLGFAFFAATPTTFMLDQIRSGGIQPIKGGRVDAISEYLRPRLRPGDTVQPLDWTGGAAHALLLAEARPATRFVYDVMFYHHISGKYTQGLRREFVTQLQLSEPRFIVEVFGEDKPWVKGEDTTREFPELKSLLQEHYVVIAEGNGYRILERKDNKSGLGEFPRR
ncbi:MAG: hypothetical protein WEB37_08125 [Bacteroidota bacterium]